MSSVMTMGTIICNITDDTFVESDEEFQLMMSSTAGSDVIILTSTISIIIRDNDG